MKSSVPTPALTNLEMQTEQITMFFSAKKLPESRGTTDSFASVHHRDNTTGELSLLGYTEVVMDNCHPTWMTHIIADYQFQEIQEIVVRVYHKHAQTAVGPSPNHKLLGETCFHQSALMMSPGSKLQMWLHGSTGIVGSAELIVRGEAVAATRDVFCAAFQCNNLTRKNGLGIFGKSDPYIKISRKFNDGTYSVVWQSGHIKGDLNPMFAHNRISMLPLCNGDPEKELSIDLYDYDAHGNHKHMGGFKTTVFQLLKSNGTPFTLIEPSRVGSFMYSNSGTFRCVNAKIEEHHTLGQYIMGGLEIHLTVAIDFTASNGDPHTRKSLHRIGQPGERMNDYEKAIMSVGSVMEPYSNDKKFGVYGFGAKIKQPDGSLTLTQHCFPIYGGESIVQGTNGIIQAYHDALSVVSLSGPTYFRPLIDCGGYLATERGCSQERQSYTVMMILTDGIIDDKDETIQSIIRASNTPLSILIIGIGDEDFTEMDYLDGDEKLLEQGGAKAVRDIVQFVPFKKFMQEGPVALAQSVLAEIPSQVIKHMENNKIKPNKPQAPPAYEEAPPPAF